MVEIPSGCMKSWREKWKQIVYGGRWIIKWSDCDMCIVVCSD